METCVWLLGAPDPEMALIERLLRSLGEQVLVATCQGRRVSPASAYRAQPPDAGGVLYLVECDCVPAYPGPVVRVDHHRPGDPGYGQSPERFLQASSLGQVLLLTREHPGFWAPDAWWLGGRPIRATSEEPLQLRHDGWGILHPSGDTVRLAQEIVFGAAADHCLGAAYRGLCPGVDPEALMRWRVETRAQFQGRSADELLALVQQARRELRTAPVIELEPGVYARDLRGRQVPELPEASAREGVCFVADGLPDESGRVKVVCQSGTPQQIRAFLRTWGPATGLVDIYGDPERGFAGGYLTS